MKPRACAPGFDPLLLGRPARGVRRIAATVIWQQARIGLRRVDRELDRLTATVAEPWPTSFRRATRRRRLREVVAAPRASGTSGEHLRCCRAAVGSDVRDACAEGAANPSAGEPASEALATSTPDGLWRLRELAGQPWPPSTFTIVAVGPTADTERERSEAVEAMWLAVPVLVLAAARGWLLAGDGRTSPDHPDGLARRGPAC